MGLNFGQSLSEEVFENLVNNLQFHQVHIFQIFSLPQSEIKIPEIAEI